MMETLESFEKTNHGPSEDPESRSSRIATVGLILFGIASFFFFLVMKLPEARIQNFIIAHLRIMAQEQGMLFSAEKVRIGILLGPSIKIENAELKSIDNERQSIKIAYLKIRPHLFSLITNTKKASISAELLGGEISGAVGGSPTTMYADLDLDSVNFSTSGPLKAFLPVPLDLSARIKGRIKLDIDSKQIGKSEGDIKLSIEKLLLPPQSVYGFNLPKIGINETKIEVAIAQGAMVIRNLEAGKDTKTDDLVGKVTGDGTLDANLMRSRVNLKASFQLSSNVIQSFPLLDALLGPAKTPDGKYTYRLTGPLSGLEARPGG